MTDNENENPPVTLDQQHQSDSAELSEEIFQLSDTLLKQRAADVSHRIARDIHLREVNYKTHEFIKLSDVTQLVTDLMQPVMDKLNQRDKQATTLKQLVRKIDVKQKN